MRLTLLFALPGVGLLVVALALRQLEIGGNRGIAVADYPATFAAVDRPAPVFALPTLGGAGKIGLGGSAGYILVLNFWASWCRPCKEEAPVLETLSRDYAGRGVRFLGVNSRDSRTDALAFQQTYGITYPSVFDPEGSLEARYRVFGIPTTFLIGPGGRIHFELTGRVRPSRFRDAVASMLMSDR
jgi:thiol-disulfide isomerase/thioredoxin